MTLTISEALSSLSSEPSPLQLPPPEPLSPLLMLLIVLCPTMPLMLFAVRYPQFMGYPVPNVVLPLKVP